MNENRVTAAAISPDGKTLLFATFGGPVYRRRMSDGNSQPLDTLKGLRVDRMVWFNDGSKVLINGSMAGDLDKYEPGIWVMPAEGGRLEQVASGAKNGVPSPDGSRIAFTSTDGSLLSVASLTGGERRQIRSGGETTSFSSLVWSPDGKRIAFQRMEYMPPAELASDPNVVSRRASLSNTTTNRLTWTPGKLAASAKDFIMESACGLRDGSVLFLRNTIEQPFIYHLWKLRTDPQTGKFLDKPRLYTHVDYELKEISASADGKEVVAVRGVNGHPNVYVADLPPAGQYPRFMRVRRLTFTDADEYPHSWTPDSRSIIFESFGTAISTCFARTSIKANSKLRPIRLKINRCGIRRPGMRILVGVSERQAPDARKSGILAGGRWRRAAFRMAVHVANRQLPVRPRIFDGARDPRV